MAGGRLDLCRSIRQSIRRRMWGDEPLLLARHLPSWIARDRVAGAKAAAEAGAGMVLMDDGLQNPALAKTVSLLVVDGVQGFGNGRFLPAGPLREPAGRALARADAVVLVGDGGFSARDEEAGVPGLDRACG